MTRDEIIKGLESFKADLKPFAGCAADWKKVDDALALLKAQEQEVVNLQTKVAELTTMQEPPSVRECKDLQVLRDIKSGKVLKSGCKDYVIYNGDWYRKNRWDWPEKAQEPRVLTLDELQELQQQDVVWLEDVDKEAIIPGIVVTAYKKEWQFATFIGYSGLFCVSCVDYGKRWRCWTYRPTDAQMEETPWPGA